MDYHCLIAGLPEIGFDDAKAGVAVAAFRDELHAVLSANDKRLIDVYFTRFDNSNLLRYLQNKDATHDERGNLSREELEDGMAALRDGSELKSFPPYFKPFVEEYAQAADGTLWDDRLADKYYRWAMGCGNRLVSEWFEFNLDVNNILVGYACRRHNAATTGVVGDNEVAQAVRTSSQRDFGLAGVFDYLAEMQRIAEEPDLYERERKTDLLRWQWLDDKTFFHYFSIERVFACLVKLEIVERWASLDHETGRKMFRKMIEDLIHQK